MKLKGKIYEDANEKTAELYLLDKEGLYFRHNNSLEISFSTGKKYSDDAVKEIAERFAKEHNFEIEWETKDIFIAGTAVAYVTWKRKDDRDIPVKIDFGIVVEVEDVEGKQKPYYPVIVEFPDGVLTFTKDGRRDRRDYNSSLRLATQVRLIF